MELEEKILNSGLLVSLMSLFLPWLASPSVIDTDQTANAFGYRLGYIGHLVFSLLFFALAMTLSPLVGGPVLIRKSRRFLCRFCLLGLSSALLFTALTILFRVTSEISMAEIRFGMYTALGGCVLSTLYAFLRFQEYQRQQIHELFRHPDEAIPVALSMVVDRDERLPPPPPPPTPPPAEDHQLHRL